jgi:hypothetical protein
MAPPWMRWPEGEHRGRRIDAGFIACGSNERAATSGRRFSPAYRPRMVHYEVPDGRYYGSVRQGVSRLSVIVVLIYGNFIDWM